MNPRRYRRAIPDRPGWWLWKEWSTGYTPERLLIVGRRRHFEVATDDLVARATGQKYSPPEEGYEESPIDNYREMSDCNEMGGLWMFDGEEPTLK
jgi:hypothetical protein